MPQVVPGLERWLAAGPSSAGLSRGARIGLLAHPASVDRRARHAVELLLEQDALQLERLFAPEHGLWGHEQDMEGVERSSDPHSGLPVVSLYGSTEATLRPSADDLDGLDAMVVDLQDVGSRYYTFIYTMSFVMEACAARGLPVVVLDRPNPIGGLLVEGPVLHPQLASFVGRYPLPVRHGMTAGELASMFNDESAIGCDLRVVPMEGWTRETRFEDCRLPWVPPSPNMPGLTTARVYPGGCLVEGTNLSEARGTTLPFELVGAPWIDGHALATALRKRGIDGACFRAASFRPMFQKHSGAGCRGVQVVVEDPDRFRPFACYLDLLSLARAQDASAFAWREEAYEFVSDRLAIDLLLGRQDLRGMIEEGASAAEMEPLWLDELKEFESRRRAFLAYG